MNTDLTSIIVEKVLKKLGIKSEEYLTPSEQAIVDAIKDVLIAYPEIKDDSTCTEDGCPINY